MIITRKFLASLNFRRFEANDFMGFGGVQSPVPLICETDEFFVILDGNYCEYYSEAAIENGDFEPTETCENVCELPY
jgi:hypothetical protein